jgi:5-methylcytosine-specific restriction endonuclease McrA
VRRWKAKNPERHRAYNKAYAQRNPEGILRRARKGAAVRRARIAQATVVKFTQAELDARMAYYGNRCWVCGAPGEQVDHVKPLVKRGPHMLANLRPICGWCNKSKKDRWPFLTVEHLTVEGAA